MRQLHAIIRGAAPLIALGVAFLSLWNLWRPITTALPWLTGWDFLPLLAGIITISVGIGLFIVSVTKHSVVMAKVSLGSLPYHGRVDCVRATVADLIELRNLYASCFGADIPSVALMKKWIDRNPEVLWKLIERHSNGNNRIIGSFKLMPLNRSGVERLEHGLATGTTLGPRELVKRGGRATAIYVGDVIGVGTVGRYEVMWHIRERLKPVQAQGIPVYARALTVDGLRILKKYGFRPLDFESDEIRLRVICRLA